MPRIRSLKPEHKQHRKVGPLSHFQYRLWVGLITEADDHGRVVAEPEQLRAIIFPYHPKETPPKIQAGLEHLSDLGLCRLYRVGSVQYADLPSWRDHQKVAHPAASKLPEYKDSRILTSPHEDSRGFMTDLEGRGSGRDQEGSGKEGSAEGRETAPPAARLEGAPAGEHNGSTPGRHAYQRVLDRIRREHPELTKDEAETRALVMFGAGVRT